MAVQTEGFLDKLKALSPGKLRDQVKSSARWFRNKVKEVQGRTFPAARKLRQQLRDDQKETRSTPLFGRMYFYRYDAATKEKLPFWDAYPLVFPYDSWNSKNTGNNGFWGINLHYLYVADRGILMDVLAKGMANNRLQISHGMVKSLMKSEKRIVPCLKKYLWKNVRGKFVEIEQDEWDTAILLPVQQFQKASASTVWKDSASYY